MGKPWWLLGVVAVVALVVGGLGGWAITNATKASTVPAAEPVARQLATVLATAHGNIDYADRAAALFAKNAIATDVPSGYQALGRDQIRSGWANVIAEAGAWRIGPVLANNRSAVVVATRTRTALGRKVSTPWVLLLKVRNGLVVSESDIYDAKSWRW
jgi:hypothetical protein